MKRAFLVFSVLFTAAVAAQTPSTNDNHRATAPVTVLAQARVPGHPPQQQEEDLTLKHMEEDRLRALNKKRQEDLKKDADKLLQLATELKLSVDKSNEHTLSVDVINRCEEIEKLARSVKNKMKGQ